MKTKLTFLALLISVISVAQNSISYKALIKDDLGNVIANTSVAIKFQILESDAQTNVYEETHSPATDDNGIIIVNIGEGTIISGIFDDINWGDDNHFLNVKIDSGSGFVSLGTIQFSAVPYAFHAKKAANVKGLEPIDEGNGIGWRLVDRNDNNYDNIGFNAIDFSFIDDPNLGLGAAGSYAFSLGRNGTASGEHSLVFGNQNYALNNYAIALGNNNIVTGLNSTVIGGINQVDGDYAFAAGLQNIASENYTITLGTNNVASGVYAVAIGREASASGNSSTAIGTNTTATHEGSVAMGHSTEALAFGSTALGWGTSASGGYSFCVGLNSEASSAYSIALGYGALASNGNAVAIGRNATASGQYATAIGHNTLASGEASFATGRSTEASGIASIALGRWVEASGDYSTASGYSTNAIGDYSTALGRSSDALGRVSTAIGLRTSASSYSEIAIGMNNTIYTPNSTTQWNGNDRIFSLGNGSYSNDRSNAITILKNGNTGIGTDTPQELLHISGGRLRIGSETIEDTGSNRLSFNASLLPDADDVMNLGNSNFRWNAVWSVDGTINTSDRREKKNIQKLKYGLAEIIQMQPVSFNWKNKNNPDTKLGLIAQDLQGLIPEVVRSHIWKKDETTGELTKKELDRMGVYYSDLVPVLIKAIQEQNKIIESQNIKIQWIEAKLNTILEASNNKF
jgi:hypothetical protein